MSGDILGGTLRFICTEQGCHYESENEVAFQLHLIVHAIEGLSKELNSV